ncbi:hypothetical protein CO181_03835, partial [candidate division WWE3 bacterium CG_4_9_14_3_um_filter_43_9]
MTTKSNHSDEQAFTIIEILVVVVIIGILASIVVISFNSTLTKSRISKAKADIENIDKAMNAYKIDVGELPPRGDCCSACACGTWAAWGQTQWDRAIEALRSNDGANWSGPYLKSAIPQDPWGHFYCYDDNEANCDTYGGLYQWDEMMQYTATQGVQGICPTGWHIPTDDEWKVLEGTVDSQYGVGHPQWDLYLWRGFDAGKHLKTTTGWNTNTGTDTFGFSALPGGASGPDGNFVFLGSLVYWWTSTEYSSTNKWCRALSEN